MSNGTATSMGTHPTTGPRIGIIFGTLLPLCLAAAMAISYKVEKMREGATLQEVMYVSSPQMLKRASLGYNGLLANIYWTRAVQYFGGKHAERAKDYNLLYPLLDITTTLDPNLVVAYNFGAFFVAQNPPHGAGQPDKAVELVERGIKANPNEWRLYYGLGFIHWQERQDYAAAADAFRRGSEVPGAHPFLRVLAGTMASYRGDIGTARYIWTQIYENTTDKHIKENAAYRLRALMVDEAVPQLEAVVQRFRQEQGRLPVSFREMAEMRYLRGIPLDPIGNPYQLKGDGRVEVKDPDNLPFINKGLPPGKQASMRIRKDSNNRAPE